MSDDQGMALSRRALREQRRAAEAALSGASAQSTDPPATEQKPLVRPAPSRIPQPRGTQDTPKARPSAAEAGKPANAPANSTGPAGQSRPAGMTRASARARSAAAHAPAPSNGTAPPNGTVPPNTAPSNTAPSNAAPSNAAQPGRPAKAGRLDTPEQLQASQARIQPAPESRPAARSGVPGPSSARAAVSETEQAKAAATPSKASLPAANPTVTKTRAARKTEATPAGFRPRAQRPSAAGSGEARSAAPRPTAARPTATGASALRATPAPQPAPRAVAGTKEPAKDATSSRPERSSQQRARDREVLRELRRLEQVAARSAAHEPADAAQDQSQLTRRQLRSRTSVAGTGAAAATGPVPVVRGGAGAPVTGSVPVVRGGAGAPATGSVPAAKDPAPRTGSIPVLPKSAKSVKKTPPTQHAPSGDISLEDALAVRRRTAARMAAVALPAATDDVSVFDEDSGLIDLEVLARQRELAARAAIISRRAAERQRLEQANSMRMEKVRSDPFTGALMQVRDPLTEKKLANIGVRGPETSGFRLELTGPQPTDGVQQIRRSEAAPAESADAVVPQPLPAQTPVTEDERAFGFSGALGRIRSGIAADRDLAPQDEDDPNVQPVRAVRAQGLDPLDYLTAGVRRANHTVMLTAGSVTAGGGAFVAGIVMIFTAR